MARPRNTEIEEPLTEDESSGRMRIAWLIQSLHFEIPKLIMQSFFSGLTAKYFNGRERCDCIARHINSFNSSAVNGW